MPSNACHVRIATREEIARLCGAAPERWLTPAERDTLRSFRHPDRRWTWLAGRVLAKHLVLEHGAPHGVAPHEIEIASEPSPRSEGAAGGLPSPRPPRGESRSPVLPFFRWIGFGRPRQRTFADDPLENSLEKPQRPCVCLQGAFEPWCLSISHTKHAVMAALSLDSRIAVGVDLACEDRIANGFLHMWFSEREQRQLAGCGPLEIVARWAIKEAVYKAWQHGESFTPRRIEILATEIPLDAELAPADIACRYHGVDLTDVLSVQTRMAHNHVAAFAAVDREAAAALEPLLGERLSPVYAGAAAD